MRVRFLSQLDITRASCCRILISTRRVFPALCHVAAPIEESLHPHPHPHPHKHKHKQKNCSFKSSVVLFLLLGHKISKTPSPFPHSFFIQLRSLAASTSQFLPEDVLNDHGIPCSDRNLQTARPTGGFFPDDHWVSSSRRACPTTMSCYRSWNQYFNYRFLSNHSVDVPINPLSALPSSRCYSHEAASQLSFTDQHLGYSADSTLQQKVDLRPFKLVSGSCYLPHPDKENTGGEDSHFICEEQQVIGIADGVGWWAAYGIDAGEYSRSLMSNALSFLEKEPNGDDIDPARILEKAHSVTRVRGSCTACIIVLTEKGIIHAINLGDSGFIVVRDGSTIFRSHPQQHGFNFPYQLGSDSSCDPPSSGEILKCSVKAGDVIVAGTDGLFDNLYSNEINAKVVHATRVRLSPQVTAQKIAALARERAQDKNRQTPYSAAAKEAGFRCYGGKLDDITVVVSYITSTSNK